MESTSEKPFSVAFFHPFCNTGAGGERVLWCAIRALQTRLDSWNFFCHRSLVTLKFILLLDLAI